MTLEPDGRRGMSDDASKLDAGPPPALAPQLPSGQLASLVPRESFSTDAALQRLELTRSPMLARFASSRQSFVGDRYRPGYHFVSPESRLNDPNGLCFWRGNWHLFYQGYPPEDPRQHWGHAVSDDLIHWRDLPYAIYPGPERAVFSGSTLAESDRVIAMYHGADSGNYVALSRDPLLLNWDKPSNGPVIPIERGRGLPLSYNVFDPAIWSRDGFYYSLSAGKGPIGPGGRQVASGSLFRSSDLQDWEYLHEFVEDDRFTLINDDYACPYFCRLVAGTSSCSTATRPAVSICSATTTPTVTSSRPPTQDASTSARQPHRVSTHRLRLQTATEVLL